jgi:selenocysteine lyase/cysteine desulfurase
VRRELITRFPPTFAGWAAFKGTDDYSRLTAYDPEPWPDARRFEIITLPVQDFAAMNASVSLLLDVGIRAIAEQVQALHRPLLAWAERSGATVTSPVGARSSAILCLKPRGDVAAAYQRLQSNGVMCSLREGALRLSPHLFTLPSEVASVAAVLEG